MQSSVVKRSIVIAGHKTSVSLEDDFWRMLKEIAKEHDLTLSELVAKIDAERQLGNLSSAIRLFVLGLCREKVQKYDAADRTREILANGISSTAPLLAIAGCGMKTVSDSNCARCGGRMTEVTQVPPTVLAPGILVLTCSQCGKVDSVLLNSAPKNSSLPSASLGLH